MSVQSVIADCEKNVCCLGIYRVSKGNFNGIMFGHDWTWIVDSMLKLTRNHIQNVGVINDKWVFFVHLLAFINGSERMLKVFVLKWCEQRWWNCRYIWSIAIKVSWGPQEKFHELPKFYQLIHIILQFKWKFRRKIQSISGKSHNYWVNSEWKNNGNTQKCMESK